MCAVKNAALGQEITFRGGQTLRGTIDKARSQSEADVETRQRTAVIACVHHKMLSPLSVVLKRDKAVHVSVLF